MKTTIRTQILDVDVGARTAFDDLMRIYESCHRAAFKQQLTGMEVTELRGELAQRFPELDARYRNDAINAAKAIITSQRQLLPRRLSEVEAKIRRSERKLARTQDSLRREGIIARLTKLECKRGELVTHLTENTIPTVIFGGRHHFELRRCGRISREEWRELRANRFYSRGEKNKQGNLHTRLCVQRRLACSAGDSPAGVIARSPVARIAEWRETKILKPIDSVIVGWQRVIRP